MFAVPRFAALAAVFVIALSIRTAAADPVTVMWDANPAQDDVLGYRVIVAGETGTIGEFDVGNQTFFVFPGAIAGQLYYFSVAAYNVNGIGDYALVAGFSDAPPSLADPGDQAALLGEPVVLQLDGFDIYGDLITYGANGLPPGLTLQEDTGLINGTATTVGTYTVNISATDGVLTTSLPFTWYVDGEPPTVAITSPTTEPVYPTNMPSVALEGTISDDIGIASVTWSNSRGGAGFAELTSATTWSIPEVPLKSGDNDITVTAWDVGNRTATTTIAAVLSGVSVPTVQITNPTTAPTHMTSNPTIVMAGTATDSVDVTSMLWTSDRGGSGSVGFVSPPGAGFSLWNVPVMPLLPGVNVIVVSAYNATEAEGFAVLTVTLNRAPVVTNPGAMNSLRRVGVMVPIAASDADGNQLTWSATDLPPGLDINPASGVISGAPTTIGTFATMVTVFDGITSGTASFTWTVSPVTVTPIVTAADKAYDGTTSATLTSCTLAGVLAGDSIDCTGTAAFDTAVAGAARPVTVSELTLTGPDAGYYVLASTIAGTTAAIAPLTVTPNVIAADKTYDSTTSATLTSCTVTGALGGDIVACTGTAAFSTAAVGTGKTVTATGLTLIGDAAGSYVLSTATATTTAGITAATVTPVVTAANKAYDGTTAATLTSCPVIGAQGADVVGCTGTVAFDTASVGTGKTVTASGLTLIGTPAGNYVLSSTTATTTAAITALTVTPAVTAADKVYDNTTSATLTSCTVTGALAGDVVTCTGTAAFDTASVGAGKTVTVSGLTLIGAAAGNYVLSSTTATTTATITDPDTIAPTIVLTTPTSTGTFTTTSETLLVSGTGSDNVGVTQVSWATSRGASGVATGTTAWSIAAVPLGPGETVITVTAHDNAGNTATAILTVTFVAPGAATLLTPTGTIDTATPSFSWAAVSGATHYQLWVNDANGEVGISVTYPAADVGCSTHPGTCSISPGITLVPGAAQWWIRPSNTAGVGPWGSSLTFSVPTPPDTTAPAVALTTPTAAATYATTSGTLAFVGTASDNVAVTEVRWATDRGTSGVATGTSAWTIAAMPLTAGTTVITVTARDAANNTATATLTITYTPAPPGAVTLLAPIGLIATATPSFSWTAVSNASEYQLWVNDANVGAKITTTYSAAAAGCAAGTGTCMVSPGVTLASGVATWWIRPSNGASAGPWGAGVAFTVPGAPDTTAPTAAVAMPTSTGTYTATSATLAVSGTASDNVGVTQIGWTTSGGASGIATGTAVWSIAAVPLSAGTTVITVTARDAANNTASATLTVTYTSLPPGAATLLTPTGTSASATPSFTWEAVSGATHYQLWVNDASAGAKITTTYAAAAAGCGAGTGTCTVSPGVTLAAGVATWWIRPSNGAGAGPWGAGVAFTVPGAPDTTAPTAAVTMPTSTGTYTATSATLAVSGTASDNVGVTQIGWTTSGGASGIATGTAAWSIAAVPLSAGTTVITVTARDAANNTASATLTVTYTSLPPGAATLVTPTGIASATPSFTWEAVSGATHYQLWVNDASTGAKITTTYAAAAVGCGAGTGTCTVSPGVTLAAGVATWWIRPSNGAGAGPWGAGVTFTVPGAPDTTAPTAAVAMPTSTGTYTATSATLAVSGTASDNAGVTQIGWTTSGGASGIATGTAAWSIANVPLSAGTTVITVTARDAANNTASATLTVTYTSLPPGAATLLTPTGTSASATPSFSWTAVSGATEYLLWVNDASVGAKITTTYSAAAVECGTGTGTCTVSPGVTLAPGVATWWIRPSNAAGVGPWSQSLAFTVPAH